MIERSYPSFFSWGGGRELKLVLISAVCMQIYRDFLIDFVGTSMHTFLFSFSSRSYLHVACTCTSARGKFTIVLTDIM